MTRFTFYSALLFAIVVVTAHAQPQRIITDKSPAAILLEPGTTRLHVITAGVDARYDRILDVDSGDVAPRWFVIDTETNRIIDSATFDSFFNYFPIRVGLDGVAKRLYVAQDKRIRSFDLTTLALVDDTVATGDYSTVSFDSYTRTLIAHMRPGFTSVGYIVGLVPATGDTIGVHAVGINPQMSISERDESIRGTAVYTLSEGTFFAPDAVISYSGGNPDIYNAVNNAPLGGTASAFMTFRSGSAIYALIAVTEADEVRMIDTRTHRSVGTMKVRMPSAFAIDSSSFGTISVSSALGKLYRFNFGDLALRDSVVLPGPGGAIAVRGALTAIAIPYRDATMSAEDSTVVIYNSTLRRIVDSVDVGAHPGALFFDNRGDLHAIGNTGNGTGTWDVIDGQTFQVKDRRTIASLHPGAPVEYDRAADSIYFIMRAPSTRFVVAALDANSSQSTVREIYDDSTASGELASFGFNAEYFVVTERSLRGPSVNGFVSVVRRSDNQRVVKALAGVGPAFAGMISRARQGADGVYVVNNAPGGSTMSLIAFKQSLLSNDTLGRGANHLLQQEIGGAAAVTMNGNHELVVVDLAQGTVTSRIATGTAGYDGPREAIEMVGGLQPAYAVTTYAGDVRFLEGSVNRIEPTGGKAEGIARVGDRLYVANAFELVASPGYVADSTVVIINLGVGSVSDGASAITLLEQSSPNPASDRARVQFKIGAIADVKLELRSIDGTLVATPVDRRMGAGSYAIDMPVSALPTGVYLYTLRAGGEVTSRMMQVVR